MPINENETLGEYSQRLAITIDSTSSEFNQLLDEARQTRSREIRQSLVMQNARTLGIQLGDGLQLDDDVFLHTNDDNLVNIENINYEESIPAPPTDSNNPNITRTTLTESDIREFMNNLAARTNGDNVNTQRVTSHRPNRRVTPEDPANEIFGGRETSPFPSPNSRSFAVIGSGTDNNPYTWDSDNSYKTYLNEKEGPKTVKLAETGVEAKYEDCIEIYRLGYFLKADPRIKLDYITKRPIIFDNKYKNTFIYTEIFNSIDDKGNLVSDNMTIENPNNACLLSFGKNGFGDVKLLDNPLFLKYYKENLNSNKWIPINKVYLFEKHRKIKGRKHKNIYSFKEFCLNKPMTFKGTWGKQFLFGIELETCSGMFPTFLDRKLCYSAVHDGSLRHADDGETYGLELVTDVLQGDLGLLQTKMIANEASKRCLVDKTTGVHVHVGNVTFSKENIVLMYYVYQMIQNEVFTTLPLSRRKNEYCRNIPTLDIRLDYIKNDRNYYIDKYYNDIMQILAKKSSDRLHNKKTEHPKGFKCGYDHSTARYCWVNFIPSVFNTRGNESYSIEFRPMSGTTSYIKIKNWLLICFGLVDIVENHKQIIYEKQMLSLNDIMITTYPKNGMKLINWIDKRKIKFATDDRIQNAIIEDGEYLDNEIDSNISIKTL